MTKSRMAFLATILMVALFLAYAIPLTTTASLPNSDSGMKIHSESEIGTVCDYGIPYGNPLAAPPVPSVLYPINGSMFVPTQPYLACTQVQSSVVLYYTFSISENNDLSSPLFTDSPGVGQGTPNKTYYKIGTDWVGSLTNGKVYYWRVYATDGVDNSVWSSTACFTVDSSAWVFNDVWCGFTPQTRMQYWNYTDLAWRMLGFSNRVFSYNSLKVWLAPSHMYNYSGRAYDEKNLTQGQYGNHELLVLFCPEETFGTCYDYPSTIFVTGRGVGALDKTNMLRTFAHETGHFRGLPDLYLNNVPGTQNEVASGQTHNFNERNPPDIMNNQFTNVNFGPYDRAIINLNSDIAHTSINQRQYAPDKNYIIVTDKSGNPVPSANVNVYNNTKYQTLTGSFLSGSSIDNVPEYTGTTTADGSYLFAQKVNGNLSAEADIYFITVEQGGHTNYAWLENIDSGGLYFGYKTSPVLLSSAVNFNIYFASTIGPPSKPRNLVATTDENFVNLSWERPASNGSSPITGYKIYRGTSSQAETLLATVGNVYSFTDSSVITGTRYYYYVTAVSSSGESPSSNEVNVIPQTVPEFSLNPMLLLIFLIIPTILFTRRR